MTWVRFHGELRQGQKRGIPRALRFVYLELSHEARARRGLIELAHGMSDLDAVHDVVGGNRKEVAEALQKFTAPLSEGDAPLLRFVEAEGKRYLEVVSWKKWNPNSDISTGRVAKYRSEQIQEDTEPCNGGEPVTVTASDAFRNGDRNGGVPVPRARGRASPSLSLSDSVSEGVQGEAPSHVRIRAAAPAGPAPMPVDLPLTDEARAAAAMLGVKAIDSEWTKFRAHYRQTGAIAVDWYAGWQKWAVNAAKYEARERDRERNRGKPQTLSAPSPPIAEHPLALKPRERHMSDADYSGQAKRVLEAIRGIGDPSTDRGPEPPMVGKVPRAG